MDEARVSVVVLNWNCRAFLGPCLDSVYSQDYPSIDLLVVDNGSTDNSVEFVRRAYPNAPVLVHRQNLGFAKAHNRAIRQSTSEFYMPLNPDVILTPSFVKNLVAAVTKEKRRGVSLGSASGKLYFTDDAGSPTNRLYTTGHTINKNRKPHNRGYKRVDRGEYDEEEYIFGVNGACPLYCRDMLEDTSLNGEYFDELFFVYGDDYDLAWRAQLMGWKSIYVPDAIAYHSGKGSGGLRMPQIQYQYARNRYLTLLKNDLVAHFVADLPYILAYELLWQVYYLITDPRRSWAHLRAFLDFIKLVPRVLEKRKLVQSRRSVSADYIRSLFAGVTIR